MASHLDSYDWSCLVNISFHGGIHIYALDDCPGSKAASIDVDLSVGVAPIGAATAAVGPTTTAKEIEDLALTHADKSIISYWSQDINISKWGSPGWKASAMVHPYPPNATAPHYIFVEVRAKAGTLGETSHSLIDFSTGNYGVHCADVQVSETSPTKPLFPAYKILGPKKTDPDHTP